MSKPKQPSMDELIMLAWQYRDDMRYPPEPDSRKRRIEWIESVLGERAEKRMAAE
jgi:hypothetical protein